MFFIGSIPLSNVNHVSVQSKAQNSDGRAAFPPTFAAASHLVVIWEGDDRGADAEDHGRVDLAVRVRRAVAHALLVQVVGRHRQHDGLLLHCVDVLHHAARHQVLPTVVTARNF